MKTILLTLMLILTCSCQHGIKYQDDLNFLNSAQANAMEFPVKVKGRVCLDIEGMTGLCSVRIDTNQDFVMSIDPQEYEYRYKLTCSREVNADQSGDVAKGTPIKLTVPKANIVGLKSFICIGEIFPADRTQELSARWEVRIKVQDENYQEREGIYQTTVKGRNVLVLGKHARLSRVCVADKCKSYRKKTAVQIEADSKVTVYSESHNMRYNFYATR